MRKERGEGMVHFDGMAAGEGWAGHVRSAWTEHEWSWGEVRRTCTGDAVLAPLRKLTEQEKGSPHVQRHPSAKVQDSRM